MADNKSMLNPLKDSNQAPKQRANAHSVSHGTKSSAIAMQRKANDNEEAVQGKFTAQKAALEEEKPVQGKFTIQKAGLEEEEKPVQGKFMIQKAGLEEEEKPKQAKFITQRAEAGNETHQLKPFQLHKEATATNNTGMPDSLKAGVENLSGMDLSDVKVHYNSASPAQLQAHAYAQGTDIHIAPGQEKHLPHEAWHVVQQKQGRVQPTMQMKGGTPVNDDAGLEKEADTMGAKAVGFNFTNAGANSQFNKTVQNKPIAQFRFIGMSHSVVQRGGEDGKSTSGGTGNPIGNFFRNGINGIAGFFGGLGAREHNYQTPPRDLGPERDLGGVDNVRQTLVDAPVEYTVPGAIIGRGGQPFGPREEGGTAYAFMGGPVTTTTDAHDPAIINTTQRGHLFGGRVRQRFYVQNGRVMTYVTGTGYGNFAFINEFFGPSIFIFQIWLQRRYLQTIMQRPPSSNH